MEPFSSKHNVIGLHCIHLLKFLIDNSIGSKCLHKERFKVIKKKCLLVVIGVTASVFITRSIHSVSEIQTFNI